MDAADAVDKSTDIWTESDYIEKFLQQALKRCDFVVLECPERFYSKQSLEAEAESIKTFSELDPIEETSANIIQSKTEMVIVESALKSAMASLKTS